jgi:hypothetical protein
MTPKWFLPFFRPEAIVVVGVSNSPEKLGYGVARNLIASGYRGAIHFVSKKEGELFNRKVHKDMNQVPGPLDLAVLIVPNTAMAAASSAWGSAQRTWRCAEIDPASCTPASTQTTPVGGAGGGGGGSRSPGDLLAYVLNNVGVGILSPEATLAYSETYLFRVKAYYRFGLTIGGDQLVLNPFNRAMSTLAGTIDGNKVALSSSSQTSPNQRTSISSAVGLDGPFVAVSTDFATRTKHGPVSAYNYAGLQYDQDMRGPAIALGVLVATRFPGLLPIAVRMLRSSPVMP